MNINDKDFYDFKLKIELIKQYKEQKNLLKKNKNNIFKILKLEDFEIRHSNFLCWLLDFNRNIDLATMFIKRFLKRLKFEDNDIENLVNNVMLNPEKNYEVTREEENKDLLIKFLDKKIIIVIENKIYSTEGIDQLKKYYNDIKYGKYKDFESKFVYLTINGDLPLQEFDRLHWQSFSYKEIKDILTDITKDHCYKNLDGNVRMIIEDYIYILDEKTESTMDRVKEYFKLYEKNKDIMVEISKYVPQIAERAEIEKTYLKNNFSFNLESEKQCIYIEFKIKEIEDVMIKNNLPNDLFTAVISNEPYNKCMFIIEMSKDSDFYKSFVKDFRNNFGISELKERNGNFVHLYSHTFVVSKNENGSYKTEQEFKDRISMALKEFFENKDSEYFKIINYIKNYDFNNIK